MRVFIYNEEKTLNRARLQAMFDRTMEEPWTQLRTSLLGREGAHPFMGPPPKGPMVRRLQELVADFDIQRTCFFTRIQTTRLSQLMASTMCFLFGVSMLSFMRCSSLAFCCSFVFSAVFCCHGACLGCFQFGCLRVMLKACILWSSNSWQPR